MQSNLEIVLEPGECGKSVKRVDNVLVMTIEELKDVWNTALGWGDEVKNFNDKSYTFKEYLTSKGINI
jgi:hypothetical protein